MHKVFKDQENYNSCPQSWQKTQTANADSNLVVKLQVGVGQDSEGLDRLKLEFQALQNWPPFALGVYELHKLEAEEVVLDTLSVE